MATFGFRKGELEKLSVEFDAKMTEKIKDLAFALDSWGIDVIEEIRKELARVGAIDQGLLQASTTSTPATIIGTKIRKTIYNPLEYAIVVEFGRHAGGKRPPLQPIIGWASRRGIISALPVNADLSKYDKEMAAVGAIMRRMGKGSKSSSKSKQKPLDPIVRDILIVRLIAKKIQEKGIAGRHPFTISWERKARTFKQDILSKMN